MFTGIVEAIGRVESMAPDALRIAAPEIVSDCHLGDSIAVNGVCLTVTEFDEQGFSVGISPETQRRTNLGDLRPGDGVNLERALRPDSRLGGHIVQGHIEGTGTVESVTADGDALLIWFHAPGDLLRFIVPKGFIAIDGISLTVIDATDSGFSITLVAYSQQHVTLTNRKPGDRVNLETDIIGRYVERLLATGGGARAGFPAG